MDGAALSGEAVSDLALWQALCWSIFTGDPIATSGLFTLLLERGGGVDRVAGGVASIGDGNVAHPVSVRDAISAQGSSDDRWGLPFAFVDPREPLGMMLFGILGIGAMCFAMAGVPARVYAGVRLSEENAFALRITLGFAGLILLLAAGLGQLAN